MNDNNKDFIKIIDSFWENDVWDSDLNYIIDQKIIQVIKNINDLKKKESGGTIFNIDNLYNLQIDDTKHITKEINKIKKENLNYFKKHAECFIQYHCILNKLNNNSEYNNLVYLNDSNKSSGNLSDTDNYSVTSSNINSDNSIKSILDNNSSINISNDEIILKNIIKKVDGFVKKINIDESSKDKIKSKLIFNIEKNSSQIINIYKSETPIILVDCENILKAFSTQNILKTMISKEEYKKYFKIWNYGIFEGPNFNDKSELSNFTSFTLHEYSNKTKYIEPFTSLSIPIEKKIYFIKKIFENYFSENNYTIVFIFNNKNSDEVNQLDNNFIILTINYQSNDIREQDDHLLIFLYELMINNNAILLSNDKFKFYKGKIINKIFKIQYNFILSEFDNQKNLTKLINFVIADLNEDDVILYKNCLIKLPINNFPLITENEINKIVKNNIEPDESFCFLLKLFLDYQTKQDISNTYPNIDKKINVIIENLYKSSNKINKLYDKLFNLIQNKTKKEVFKIILDEKKIIDHESLHTYKDSLKKYYKLIDCYLIIRCIKKHYFNENFIIQIVKLFGQLIYFFDQIDKNIYKIRKLSTGNNEQNKIFLKLNSTYLYIKKIGFFRKNF